MTDATIEKRKVDTDAENAAKKAKLDTDSGALSATEKANSTGASNEQDAEKVEVTLESGEKIDKTATNSKGGGDVKKSEPENEPAAAAAAVPVSARPVFGAASSFGNASIFEKMKNKTNAKAPAAASSFGTFGGSFGASSKFSNALQKATQKKSFLDEPTGATDSKPDSPSASSQQYKQVELTEKKVETGEENESSLFSTTAKLFELDLDNVAEGWKERGRGPLHLNQSQENPAEARLVMRSNGLLRVILNYKVTPTTDLIKGLEASLSPGKFLRMASLSGGKPVQYLLKFLNQDIRDGLFDRVAELKSEIERSDKSSKKSDDGEKKEPQETGFRFIPDPSEKTEKS
ncbi:hypothetical protein HF325_001364 [Metschnikowia pulcherrima]|uniref:RanBD1 domain-containing protein n=1 Tax=Metschnikowia pulcherrima TaxID=27326 RepID=A0A8H7GWK3_9ASCO|nr:hypothetical protein HF325_001364 [Metschnikowia pulcherrima]